MAVIGFLVAGVRTNALAFNIGTWTLSAGEIDDGFWTEQFGTFGQPGSANSLLSAFAFSDQWRFENASLVSPPIPSFGAGPSGETVWTTTYNGDGARLRLKDNPGNWGTGDPDIKITSITSGLRSPITWMICAALVASPTILKLSS